MALELDGLAKRYGETIAVEDVDLNVGEHETVALLGPSGCGKSTLLRLVAGLERPDRGRIAFDGVDLTHTPPQRRGFGMVFQDYALFPHLNVADNVAFGLVELGWERQRRNERVAELLELTGLAGLGRRRVDALSGGQQQRVALARALAPAPRVLLLDEPLSNLDLTLREDLKRELRELLDRLDVRAIYVTHDQAEALAMGQRIGVMRQGRLVQVGPALEVVERPRSAWVAAFLGHRNILRREQLGRIPGAPDAAAAVLRSDLLVLASPTGDHGVPAVVESVRRAGLGWQLDLRVEPWGVRVGWDGFARDLAVPPASGDRVRLVVPGTAWVPLEGEP